MEHVKVSVRHLVEFVLRGGDIDNRYGGADRALEGARIHRRLQKLGGDDYAAEVFLSIDQEVGGFRFTVEGRADGVITAEDGVTIDEIKTTAAPLTLIEEDTNRLHWAQAMCYAHILCARDGLPEIGVRLTYYQIESGEIKRFHRSYTAAELAAFFTGVLEDYVRWADFETDWQRVRDASIKALPFPFPAYRRGQRRMAADVYRTVRDGGRYFCQAPTGIGKTISALYPSIKAIGEGVADKIFYLTAKTITRQAAEEACAMMRGQGLRLKSVTLTAKDKICFLEERRCNPEDCPYAKGHFDRVNDALFELLGREDAITRETVESCAQAHTVCPFELALDATLYSDCVIGDYNYVFDPQVYLRRFFSGGAGDYVFLVDEAHNLVDRAREMYSAGVTAQAFRSLAEALDPQGRLYGIIRQLAGDLAGLGVRCQPDGYHVEEAPLEELNRALYVFVAECEEWLKRYPGHEAAEAALSLYFEAITYLKIAEFYDERYVTFMEAKEGDVLVRQLCLDPSYQLSECMKRGKATVFFSATLTPLSYFTAVLGGDEETKTQALPSPYAREHLCLLVADRISTKYKDRAASYEVVADMIARTAEGRTGNYIAYFPSYRYMNDVYEVFTRRYPETQTLLQTAHMGEAAREEFLARFDEANRDTLVGFCVMGGLYAEGIDLKGDRLIGTIVVGVGLPQINAEQDVIKTYFDRIDGCGFDYAYRFPGMNKVLQAAGRVIRGEQDRGVVLLIDQRFTTGAYRRLFPEHWWGYTAVRSPEELEHRIRAFWQAGPAE